MSTNIEIENIQQQGLDSGGGPDKEQEILHDQRQTTDFIEDDDFGNVDEFEEGDASMHKNHDALILKNKGKADHGQQDQNPGSSTSKHIQINSFNVDQMALSRKSNYNDSKNNIQPRTLKGSADNPNNQSMQNINNTFDIFGDAPKASSSFYIPRQKSKKRMAGKLIYNMSKNSSKKSLSRNDPLSINQAAISAGQVISAEQINTELNNSFLKQEYYNNVGGQNHSMILKDNSPFASRKLSQQVDHAFPNLKSGIRSYALLKSDSRKRKLSYGQINESVNQILQGPTKQMPSIKYQPPPKINQSKQSKDAVLQAVTQSELPKERQLPFNKAYEKLVQEMSNQIAGKFLVPQQDLMTSQEFQDIYGFNEINSKLREQIRSQRLFEYQQKKQDKIVKRKQDVYEREMKECTFKPQIVSVRRLMGSQNNSKQSKLITGITVASISDVDLDSKSNTVRGLDEFLSDQQKFLDKKKQKREIKRNRLDEDIKKQINVIKVNIKSNQILKKRQEKVDLSKQFDVRSQKETSQSIDIPDNSIQNQNNSKISKLNIPANKYKRIDNQKKRFDNHDSKQERFQRPVSQTHSHQMDLNVTVSRSHTPSINRPDKKQKIQDDMKKIAGIQNEINKLNKKIDFMTYKRNNSFFNKSDKKSVMSDKSKSVDSQRSNLKNKKSDQYLLQKFNKEFDKARDAVFGIKQNEQKSNVKDLFKEIYQNSEERSLTQTTINESPNQCLFQKFGPKDCIYLKQGSSLKKIQVQSILTKLGLIQDIENIESNKESQYLFLFLWKQLRPDSMQPDFIHETIYSENLRLYLQVILRLVDPKRVCEPQDNQTYIHSKLSMETQLYEKRPLSSRRTAPYGYIDKDGIIYIRPKEVQSIQTEYSLFYINRLSYQYKYINHKKHQIKEIELNRFKYQPEINSKSKNLSQQKRKKILIQMGVQEHLIDSQLLSNQNLLPLFNQHHQKSRKQNLQKMQSDEIFKKNHTFMPDTKLTKGKVIPKQYNVQRNTNEMTTITSMNLQGISQKRPSKYKEYPRKSGSSMRHHELHRLHKRSIDQRDKSRIDYEFEKQQTECTFRPSLTKSSSKRRTRLQRLTSQDQQHKQTLPSTQQSKTKLQQQNTGGDPTQSINIDAHKQGGRQVAAPAAATATSVSRQQLSKQKNVQRMRDAHKEKLKREQVRRTGNVKQGNAGRGDKRSAPIKTTAVTKDPVLIQISLQPKSEVIDYQDDPMSVNGAKMESQLPLPCIFEDTMESKLRMSTEQKYRHDSDLGPSTLKMSSAYNEHQNVHEQKQSSININEFNDIRKSQENQDNDQYLQQQQEIPQATFRPFMLEQSNQQQAQIDDEVYINSEPRIQESQNDSKPNIADTINNTDPNIEELQNNNEQKISDQQERQLSNVDNNLSSDGDIKSINSDNEEAGVPSTLNSDIREAIEQNQQRQLNLNSTRRSISILESDFKESQSHLSEKDSDEANIEQSPVKITIQTNLSVQNIENHNNEKEDDKENISSNLTMQNANAIQNEESSNNANETINEQTMDSQLVEQLINHDREIVSPIQNSSDQHSLSGQLVPLLYINVNLGPDHQERITIFDGDKPEDLSQKFCLEHKLEVDMQEQLTQMIIQQMQSILPKVIEEAQEDYYQDDSDDDAQ